MSNIKKIEDILEDIILINNILDMISNNLLKEINLCKKNEKNNKRIYLDNGELIDTVYKNACKVVRNNEKLNNNVLDFIEENRKYAKKEETIVEALNFTLQENRSKIYNKIPKCDQLINDVFPVLFNEYFPKMLEQGQLNNELQTVLKDTIKLYQQIKSQLKEFYSYTFENISGHLYKKSCIPIELSNDNTKWMIATSSEKGKPDIFNALIEQSKSLLYDTMKADQIKVNFYSKYDEKENYYANLFSIMKGERGEFITCKVLEEKLSNSILLHGIRTNRYAGEGEFSENDVIVLNKYGIFSLEIKNRNLKNIKVYANGNVLINDIPESQNMITQASEHARSLTRFLIENKVLPENTFLRCIPISVITNESTIIENQGAIHIYHLSDPKLIDIIEPQEGKEIISNEQLFKIKTTLEDKMIDLGKYGYDQKIKTLVTDISKYTDIYIDILHPLNDNYLLFKRIQNILKPNFTTTNNKKTLDLESLNRKEFTNKILLIIVTILSPLILRYYINEINSIDLNYNNILGLWDTIKYFFIMLLSCSIEISFISKLNYKTSILNLKNDSKFTFGKFAISYNKFSIIDYIWAIISVYYLYLYISAIMFSTSLGNFISLFIIIIAFTIAFSSKKR